MNPTIQVEGLAELHKRLKAIPAELDRQARPAMHRAVVMLTEGAQRRVYSPTGRAKAGIVGKESGSGKAFKGEVRARSKAAKHSIRGRPAGKQPKIGPVRAFMKRAGHPVSRSAAFLIARAIGRRGTKGKPVMEATIEAKRNELLGVFIEALRRALRGGQ